MPKRPRFAKIAISLPRPDLAAADQLARERDRSRSWIIAEAVRRYVAQPDERQRSPGLGASRQAQLIADMRLSPEERVRAAEDTAREFDRSRRGTRGA